MVLKSCVLILHPRAVELEKLKDEKREKTLGNCDASAIQQTHILFPVCATFGCDDGDDDVNGDTMRANDVSDARDGQNMNINKPCLKEISCVHMCYLLKNNKKPQQLSGILLLLLVCLCYVTDVTLHRSWIYSTCTDRGKDI